MVASLRVTTQDVLDTLEEVKDPEIDTVSIIDLGMVEEIIVQEDSIYIQVLPTFSGCPALEIIKGNIVRAVKAAHSVEYVQVKFITSPPWTSDRITEKGRQGLKAFGISPPSHMKEDGSWHIDCPYCGSTYVTMENIFGPTACRSILYCKSCKNPFEAMKPMSTLL